MSVLNIDDLKLKYSILILKLLTTTVFYGQKFNIKNYSFEHGLVNSGITSIGFEKNNQLWVGTRKQGLYCFTNNLFENRGASLKQNDIFGVYLINDSKGELWYLNPNSGVSVCKIKNRKFNIDSVHLLNVQPEYLGVENKDFNIAYLNDIPYLYYQTNSIIFIYNLKTFKVETKIYSKENAVRNSFIYKGSLIVIKKQGVYSINAKEQKLILNKNLDFITYHNELLFFLENKTLFQMNLETKQISKISKYPENQFTNESYKTLYTPKGVFIYNLNYIKFYDFKSNKIINIEKKNGLVENGANQIILDKENNIWVCHGSGISKIFNFEFNAYYSDDLNIKNDEITAFLKTKNGFVLGGNEFLVRTDVDFKIKQFIDISKVNENYIDRVLFVKEFNNHILFSYLFGLGILKNNQTIIQNNMNYCLAIENFKNECFISNKNNLYRFDKFLNKNLLKSPNGDPIRNISFKNDSIIVLSCFKSTCEISLFDSNYFKKLLNISSFSYCYDTKNRVSYFGTSKGLYYSENQNQPQRILIKNDSNIQVYSTKLDIYQHLWIGTNNGIYILNTKTKKLLDISSIYYIKGFEVNRGAFYLDSNYLYAGTNFGLYKIPIKLETKNYRPELNFTTIKTNKNSYENIDQKKFYFKENEFEFYFELNSFINESKNQYSYILEGYDVNWSKKTNLNFIRYTNLPHGKYTFKVKSWNVLDEESKIKEIVFYISPPFWKTNWFIIGIIILVFLVLRYLYYLKEKKLKNEYLNELYSKTNELKLYKSQINPHLISNILGSIQLSIMQNKIDFAGEIVDIYNQFLRRTIEYVANESVDLQTEINFIENYIRVEQISNKNAFKLEIDNQISDLNFKIPSMIIQPIVENSIKHGFNGIKSKDLKIKIQLIDKKNSIIVEITDNGKGRTNDLNKKSYGTSITKERIKLYANIHNTEFMFLIEDLKDPNNLPLGTKVNFIIPKIK